MVIDNRSTYIDVNLFLRVRYSFDYKFVIYTWFLFSLYVYNAASFCSVFIPSRYNQVINLNDIESQLL